MWLEVLDQFKISANMFSSCWSSSLPSSVHLFYFYCRPETSSVFQMWQMLRVRVQYESAHEDSWVLKISITFMVFHIFLNECHLVLGGFEFRLQTSAKSVTIIQTRWLPHLNHNKHLSSMCSGSLERLMRAQGCLDYHKIIKYFTLH